MNIALPMNVTPKTETNCGLPGRAGAATPQPIRRCTDTIRLPRLELAHASRGRLRDYYRALRAAEMAAWEAADRRAAAA